MRLSRFGTIFSSMYSDRMSISRAVEIQNSDGTDGISLPTPVYTDLPCRISFSSADNPESTKEDTNPKYLQIKLFCAADTDVQKGDKIVAQKLDDDGNILSVYEGIANLPLQFVTHKEVLLVQNGDA